MRNLLFLPLLCLAMAAQAQYNETFSTPNKGYLLNNVDDFTAVNWSITAWTPDPVPSGIGRDVSDYFQTTAAGVMESIDLDMEVCWMSPVLTVSNTGNISFTAELDWFGFDNNQSNPLEYINVEYQINNGAWVRHPNVIGVDGDAAYTVRYTNAVGNNNGSATTNFAAIAVTAGNSFRVRVCISNNANAEIVQIDNVNVSGVTSGCAKPVLSTAVIPVGCGGPNTGAIDLSVTAGTPGYTYAWSSGPATQDLNNIPVGTYTVTVTDAAMCSATTSAAVASDPLITLSTQVLNATCNGAFDGEIDLVVSGGFPGYTFDWSNDGPETPDNDSENLVGLSPGTYTVTVTDAVQCTKTISATVITLPPGAYLETFSTPNKGYLANFVDDFSAVNWSLSGWAPQPPAANGRDNEDFFQTTGGVLTAVDLDQEVCWTSPVIDINPPGNVMFSVPLSWTGFDPEDYIKVSYSVNGGGFTNVANQVGGGASTIQYASGLDQGGSATVSVSNISGNTLQLQVCGNFNTNAETMTIDNVSVPGSGGTFCPAPDASIAASNVACNGASTGSLDLTVTGGSSPYTYLWSFNNATTQDLNNVPAGTYTVTVTDSNMSTATASATITQPAAIVLSTTQVNILCNGATGSIDLTVSGGVGSYTYDWSNDGAENPDNDPQDLNSLAAGTYTVTVTDANGCTKSTSATLTQPSAIVRSATQVNILCNGASTGSIDLTVSGGTPTYTYDWSNDGPETPDNDTQDLNNIAAGTYTVTITDGSGCTSTLSVTLTQPAAIIGTNAVVNIDCAGNSNGSINLSVTGGTSPYTYDWSNDGADTPDNDTEDLSGLTAGTYTVTITDASGCTNTASATVSQPAPLALNTSPTNILCNGAATGAIDLTVSGGTTSYAYDWSNDGPETPDNDTQDLSGLTAGTYSVTVTDANGCSSSTSVTLTEPAAFSRSTTQVDVLCNGASTGSIDLTVSGGATPYSYDWSNDGPETPDNDTQDLSGIGAGTYTVTITDANGCSSTISATLTQPSAIVASAVPVNILCFGLATGSIDLTVSGGTPGYTYNWSAGGATTQDVFNLTAGTYTVTITDASGCTRTNSTTITQPGPIALSNFPVNILCNGAATGSIDLNVGGGTSPFTYDWSNDGPENPDNDTQDLSGLIAGTYTVTVTDANGCSSSSSVTITQPAVLSLTASVINPTNCGVSNGSIDLSVNGGTSPFTYDWSNDGPETPDNDTQDLMNLLLGTYTVTVTDANGCTATRSETLTYTDNVAPNITCPANLTIAASSSCLGTLGTYTPLSLSDNCTANPSVTQSPAAGTVLSGHNDFETVTFTATDGNNNTATCSFTVTLKDITQPTISCPANLTLAANASCSSLLGSYSPVSVADNCNPSPAVTQSPASSTVLTGHNDARTVTFTANDGNGNTQTCSFTVTLKDVTKPAIVCPANQTVIASANCDGVVGAWSPVSVADNCNPSPAVTQSPASGTILSGHNDVETLTLTANDGNGNTEFCTFTVTLKDQTKPTISCPSNTTVAADVNCSSAIGSYTALTVGDNCTANPTVTQSPAPSTLINGNNPSQLITLTATDAAGNTQTCSFTVSIVDQIAPSITCPVNATVSANASCSGAIGSWSPASVSDNCTANPTVAQSPASSTVLSGHNAVTTVTLTATDASANTKSCSFTVTLKDVTKPSITCPANQTVNANASCSGVVGAYSAVSVSDNCTASPAVTQSPASSTILSGHNDVEVVTLTATDNAGNTQTCTFTVTLKDITAPTVTCKPGTVNLNAAGSGSITTGSVYQSGSDNCGTVNQVSVTPNTFTCNNLGANTVTLTVNDGNGNTATCSATITVVDPIIPTMLCKPATIQLDASGVATLTVAQINNGSFDNCSIVSIGLSQTTYSCANIGSNTVFLSGVDPSNNKGVCSATVTVVDPIVPVAKCKNVTVNLGSNGSVLVLPSQVNNGSTDNCSFTLTLLPSTFTCASIGVNTVTLRATDSGGNSATCTALVNVKDVTAPVAQCKNPTIFLNASGQATLTFAQVDNGSTDNCVISTVTLSQTQFNCSELAGSPWPVTVTMKDAYNNTSTCTASVTVKDAIAPTAVCDDVTVNLNQNGTVVVYPASLTTNSTDNCAVWSTSPAAKVYTTANIGNNNLTITVKDFSNNAATCVSVVTVQPYNGNFQEVGEDRTQLEDPAALGMRIYPNPTAGDAIVAFELSSEQVYQLFIYDVSGRMVLSREATGMEGHNTLALAMGNVSPGVYLLELRTDNARAIKRLVVQE